MSWRHYQLVSANSCFSLFYCCKTDSLLSSVIWLVIQLLEYMKLSAPSNITVNFMALPLSQQHFCMWLISWNWGHFVYFVIYKTNHIAQNISWYFPHFPELCLNFSHTLYEVLWQELPVVSHLSVITFLDICHIIWLRETFYVVFMGDKSWMKSDTSSGQNRHCQDQEATHHEP